MTQEITIEEARSIFKSFHGKNPECQKIIIVNGEERLIAGFNIYDDDQEPIEVTDEQLNQSFDQWLYPTTSL